MVKEWINRLGPIWVEGQVIDLSTHSYTTYLTLQDSDSEEVLKLNANTSVLKQLEPPITQGSRVLTQLKADWWAKRGTLHFKVLQVRTVGLGELMARLEALRVLLESEGLFRPERKKPLPFLPRRVGLICGRNSDALHDVVKNARRRWPEIEFEIREVAVQGASCVREVTQAIRELDAIDDVDVIVVTRGGGDFEDLLPFSDESLVRVVASAHTPIVAAIGHEEDKPLIDEVADYRASTPTDAARRIVPDAMQETSDIRNTTVHLRRLIQRAVEHRQGELAILRNRPALANPAMLVEQRIALHNQQRTQIGKSIIGRIAVESAHLRGLVATIKALSPQGTLERGFSITRKETGAVVSSVEQTALGENLRIRMADGEIRVTRIDQNLA